MSSIRHTPLHIEHRDSYHFQLNINVRECIQITEKTVLRVNIIALKKSLVTETILAKKLSCVRTHIHTVLAEMRRLSM